ncbi:MAG: DUF456 domain-containing protein [Bacillota bacterium]
MILLLWFLVVVMILISLIASFIPGIPDLLPFWFGILIYHFFIDSSTLSSSFFVFLVLVTLILILSDFFANYYFVKKSGGSNLSIVAAFVSLLISILFLGPLALIIGPFLGVFLVEFYLNRNKEKSFKIAFSTVFAYLSSGLIKFILQLFIAIYFVFQTISIF